MKKVLITGANSYIGQSFQKHVSLLEDVQVEELDVREEIWKQKDFSSFDTILHLAALVHISNPAKEMEGMYNQVNTQLPYELAKKAKQEGVKQFIFMSSMSVYGEVLGDRVITKDTPELPTSFYGKSKLAAEQLLSSLESEKFRIAILRPPMVYGRQAKGNYQRLSKLAQKLPIFPLVNNQRSMIYIDNLCEFIRLIVQYQDSGLFYPQNQDYVNTSQLVREIKRVHGQKVFLLPAVHWILKGLSRRAATLNKLFSDLTYAKDLSAYSQSYQVADFRSSIEKTEKGN
ncbi:NAD-dependent epimerase/dehydratase family protein [Streptococcus panodentis]|uniref:NAD-dependent epimerase n=1 Tax=Streptococcus panodentis TaxID=1581472 RepID=A0ABS5AVX8_9STRE|nr:NAD-dependent epimerase/dehydratase family protein [Streptococcus panodentis]MBP2620737.1 NAD-dependent epimerase [Streptococcus panodentis]